MKWQFIAVAYPRNKGARGLPDGLLATLISSQVLSGQLIKPQHAASSISTGACKAQPWAALKGKPQKPSKGQKTYFFVAGGVFTTRWLTGDSRFCWQSSQRAGHRQTGEEGGTFTSLTLSAEDLSLPGLHEEFVFIFGANYFRFHENDDGALVIWV